MQLSGLIQKMQTKLVDDNAQYFLPIGEQILSMNGLIGQSLKLDFGNKIICTSCGAKIKKSYSQGFCYPCAQSLASCDLCILKPETCHHHLGSCREPLWGLENCFAPHIVYFANSSGIKVGITRKNHIPNRWIDQGAISAIPLLEVDTRLKSGIVEIALKKFVTDRTNWRTMLKGGIKDIDLQAKKQELLPHISKIIEQTGAKILVNDVQNINYPVLTYPQKITSLSFDKQPSISGVLKGIKGQYLILDNGVLNIRKFSSYFITLSVL